MSAIDQYLAGYNLQINNGNSKQKPQWVTTNSFGQTYFSGLDASIQIAGLNFAEIIHIQYEVQEAVLPLFGYADYVKRTTIHGARRVFGSFTINFQQALLFWVVLGYINNPPEATTTTPSPMGSSKAVPSTQPSLYTPVSSTSANYLSNQTATKLQDIAIASKELTAPQTLAMAVKGAEALNFTALSETAQRMKTLYWNTSENQPKSNKGSSLLSSIAASIAVAPFGPIFNTDNPFSIVIRTGVVPPTYTGLSLDTGKSLVQPYSQDHLDAFSGFQNNNDMEQFLSTLPPWTLETLTDVDLTGFSRVIDDSGRPMLQTYSFIAGDYIPG